MNAIKKYIIPFAIMLLTLSACKNFLKLDPKGMPTPTTYWKTETDALKAADGLNFWMAREGVDGRGFMWFENCSDNLVTGRAQAEADQIKNFQMAAGNGRDAKENWPRMYQLISHCNDIFRYVPDMKISDKVKTKVLAEAHFYYGFAYLWLSPWYGDNGPNGGIPIVELDVQGINNFDIARPKSVLENYDRIIAEMRNAAEDLPYMYQLDKTTEWGRPHKAAAWAFAARAALYAAQYDAKYYDIVIEMCDKIMGMTGSDKRDLCPDYASLFTESQNYGSEYIFSIPGTVIDGPKFAGMSFQNGGWGYYNTWGYYQPTLELYKAYEAGDQRRDATILFPNQKIQFIGREITFAVSPSAVSSTSGMTFRKWMDPFKEADCVGKTVNPNGDNASTRLSIPLIRYADIMLMKAEALIWTKGEGNADAKTLINMVRDRAGLPMDSQATKAQLKNERRCELAFEFQPSRHLDLVRWGDAKTEYAKPLHGVKTILNPDGTFKEVEEVQIWPARNFDPTVNHVFPIPADQLTNSKNILQNQGY